MFIIANEDIGKVKVTVCEVLSTLNDGAKKVSKEVEIGDEFHPMIVTGYWVGNIIRIDIKIKQERI